MTYLDALTRLCLEQPERLPGSVRPPPTDSPATGSNMPVRAWQNQTRGGQADAR